MAKVLVLLWWGVSVYETGFEKNYAAGCYYLLFAALTLLVDWYVEWRRAHKEQG